MPTRGIGLDEDEFAQLGIGGVEIDDDDDSEDYEGFDLTVGGVTLIEDVQLPKLPKVSLARKYKHKGMSFEIPKGCYDFTWIISLFLKEEDTSGVRAYFNFIDSTGVGVRFVEMDADEIGEYHNREAERIRKSVSNSSSKDLFKSVELNENDVIVTYIEKSPHITVYQTEAWLTVTQGDKSYSVLISITDTESARPSAKKVFETIKIKSNSFLDR